MELGSAQHKQLLIRAILRTAIKTITLGLIIGGALMIPFIFRDNLFSSGLFYAGSAIIFISLIYAAYIGVSKYRHLMKGFD
ncbi:hypothetical protein [Thiomicrorhabdus sediminis]|uniref:Uncharacterized protein n=1 Tax=Thiomicrorhabdus sediminis TaxID=2580412 RepID=A0A4P9K2X7_9GAMM|nr:hypothetical protein [Thiomicrorhabdus sediminis]QCU89204.1 hypothetical protein FE785_00460 [Thiomicrorhabdus sediminis]